MHTTTDTTEHSLRRIGQTLAALMLVLGAFAGFIQFAQPAAAANPTYQTTDDVSARPAPTAGPSGVYGIPKGASFSVQCQQLGEPVGPRGNRLYFLTNYGGKNMYVPDYYTNSPHMAADPPIAGIPMCGSAPAPAPAPASAAQRAVNWARAQVGQTRAQGADAAAYSDWAPGPYGEWSGDCIKFAQRAYVAGGISVPRGNAWKVFQTYQRAGRIQGGTPPFGALVFWDTARPYGHVAVSIGGGQVIGTRGMDNANLPISQYAVGAVPGYVGWVLP